MWSLIDQLAQQGVTDFFIGSGSRSTPLVLAAARHPKITLHRHIDERGLAFFALGAALASEKPVAIIVTSGTAVGNLLPAVMEAYHASVPLILLTADRPSELRDTSGNQTTDQIKLFQNFVHFQFDLDPTMPEPAIRSKAAHAYYSARSGPVHLNCPIRSVAEDTDTTQKAPITLNIGRGTPSPITLPPKTLIFIGRLPHKTDLAPILHLANQYRFPVFADILSNARLTPTEEQVRHFNWHLKGAPKPDAIIHFGERLTSKRALEWSASLNIPYIHVSPHSTWFDPSHSLTTKVLADIPETCAQISATTDPTWLPLWKKRDLPPLLNHTPLTESLALQTLSEHIPPHVALFLGASMPIREADWFLFPKKCRGFYSNRGLSGIDGNISTAVGVSTALNCPLLAIIGDLTALHDLNALSLLAHSKQPILLLISNNQGGGIFSHLPIATHPRLDELIAFSHNLTFAHAAALFNLPYSHASTLPNLISALQWTRSAIIELPTSRDLNSLSHRHLECFK